MNRCDGVQLHDSSVIACSITQIALFIAALLRRIMDSSRVDCSIVGCSTVAVTAVS